MNCIKCKLCCIWGHAVLSDMDICRISQHLNLVPSIFIDKFLDKEIWHKFSQRVLLSDVNRKGCVFLSEIGCEIYPVRPVACAAFPRPDHIDLELVSFCEIAKMNVLNNKRIREGLHNLTVLPQI